MECFLCSVWTSCRYPWFRENSGDKKFFGGQIPQCFGSGFIKSRFRSIILGWIPIRIRMQSLSRVLLITKWKNLQLKTKFDIFFISKIAKLYPWASLKGVQATGEAFSPQNRTSSTLKTWKFLTFFYFYGHFWPPGSGSGSTALIESGSGSETVVFRILIAQKFLTVFYFYGHFCPPGSGSGSTALNESGSETVVIRFFFIL